MAKGSKLVIVESPTKARKIGGYLGDEYTVLASVGHIRDLAQPSEIPASAKDKFGKFGVDVDDGFKPYYIVGADKKKTVSELKSALKNADEVFLATDEDREGEAIAWHLVETLKPKVPVKRMVFHEITKSAITQSLSNTRDVDAHMVDAQETRRVLDRLYGYELSPVLWRKVRTGLSAGRVQSVATRLIVERERERMAFVKSSYWDITAQFNGESNGVSNGFTARLIQLGQSRVAGSKDFDDAGQLTQSARKENVTVVDEAVAQELATALTNSDFVVESVGTKPYTRRPLPPFTTSTMQQAAGNALGMSSRSTMRAAQGLYENGYITYMRTDSVTLSQEAIQAAREGVIHEWGEKYLSEKPKQYATRSAGAQEAHEAIRPAGAHFRNPAELSTVLPPDQLKLYTLIWRRTLASQMADATGSTATIRLSADSGKYGLAIVQASGTVIDFPGFTVATGAFAGTSSRSDTQDDDNNAVLPPLSQGDMLTAQEVQPQSHETHPPARYTEASLVKTLEAKEIGRPSTYASIISTIIDRGYVYERGRALIPSWLAFAVVKLLEQNFPQYVDYAFTAQMENGLDKIAQGNETGREWLTSFYFGDGEHSAGSAQEAHQGLQAQVAQLGDIDAREINTIDIGDGLAVRVGRYGPYLEDSLHLDREGKPKRASLPDTMAPDELTVEAGRELIDNNSGGPRVLGVHPQTGGTIEVRNGRFGPYVALTAIPTGDEKIDKANKPKMASLFKTMTPDALTLEDAVKLLDLPRVVGTIEEKDDKTGESKNVEILANNGRYGPYLTKTGIDGKAETRSLSSEDEIFTVTVEQAKELYAQPKYGRRARGAAKPPLRELGADPDNGKNVTIKDGFYGAYITDGETNRTLPKQYTPESIEPAEAFRLLAEKRAAGPTKRRRSAKSASTRGTKKSATTAKSATKKTTTRKTTTKKSTATRNAAKKTSSSSTSRTTSK
ncbi:type I DNA topoisomerase [Alloscardovia theropitheci]|uniref:DNA topoisomerase 1 n=1 Tax=Alloscardovia theropitheci TaxID=2496842 RepID=A0A4V2MUC9_9BIFI|nr:type I DNA topoisomerase [Alloscardovia theropitheci]TCD54529.1 type I DNA topoisomerase [Alloscardovia theropitheci]